MDTDSRIEALEEEMKLLKAEIKNVLLDIREAVLARANPLRLGMAPLEEELASVGPNNGLEAAAHGPLPTQEASLPGPEPAGKLSSSSPLSEMPQPDPGQERAPEPPPLGQSLSQWSGPSLPGGDFVAWLTNSLRELGPERLGHLLAMYRLLKPLPANVSLALGHLQELLAASTDPEPWVKALVELDRLSR